MRLFKDLDIIMSLFTDIFMLPTCNSWLSQTFTKQQPKEKNLSTQFQVVDVLQD